MATPNPRTWSVATAGEVTGSTAPVGGTPLLEARVEVDERRLIAHRRWAAGLTGAIYGRVDPFDLVTAIADRFPTLRGRVDGERFTFGDAVPAPSAVMVSADHGSAAMFTTTSDDAMARGRFVELFHPTDPFDDTAPAVDVELVDGAITTNEDLISIVTTGVIGRALVFAELVVACSDRGPATGR